MPRRKWIDKKSATTFQLLHRAQNDPLIHDEKASQMVFAEAPVANLKSGGAGSGYEYYPSSSGASFVSSASSRLRRQNGTRGDLEAEFGLGVRKNEGEAAEYGVYYDDSDYDYMQHMRDLGGGAGESIWVEAPTSSKKKGKEKQKLEDALRELEVSDSASQAGSLASGMSTASHSARDVFDQTMLPSDFVRKTSYQDQQDVPDAIRGFQPNMDPRLREVLEALEDDAYVDEGEDGDFFEELAGDGVEVHQYDWEASGWEDADGPPPPLEDDDGWETDDTIKPDKASKKNSTSPQTPSSPNLAPAEPLTTNPDDLPAPEAAPADRVDTSWQSEFAKFKQAVKAAPGAKPVREPRASRIAPDLQSESILTGTSSILSTGRRKKRKGALTNGSAFSMSSSVVPRTEAMSIMDERFEKLEKLYADDDEYDEEDMNDGVSLVSGMSGMSKMSGLSRMSGVSIGENAPRSDFDSLVDDFLGTHSASGKRRVKRGKYQTGMEQLDEIRQQLGGVSLGDSAKA